MRALPFKGEHLGGILAVGGGGDGAPSPSRGGLGWGWVFILTAETHPDIVDFVCFQARLIIEVDGGQNPRLRIGSDTRRLAGQRGYRLLRFWNSQSFNRVDGGIGENPRLFSPSPPLLSLGGRGVTAHLSPSRCPCLRRSPPL